MKKILMFGPKQKKTMLLVFLMGLFMSVMALTVAANTTTPSNPSFAIDFDVASMFTWAQTIISALMPVVYITMGLGLGFLIINALRRAFQ